jgi:cell wall assembly regulator SMI1
LPSSPADIAKLEAALDKKIPDDLRAFLLVCDFEILFEFNYRSLTAEHIHTRWASLADLLRRGTFDGRAEQRNIAEMNHGVAERIIRACWWSAGWLPFAQDSCGNQYCVDLDPGPKGTYGQVIAMEWQDAGGPSATSWSSFDAYLTHQVDLVVQRKYRVFEGIVELDRYEA